MGGFALLGPELIVNGGFETTDASSWDVADSNVSTVYVTDDQPYSGTEHAWFEVSSSPGVKLELLQAGITIPQSGANFMLTAAIAARSASYHAVEINTYGMDVTTFVPVETNIDSWHLYGWTFDSTAHAGGGATLLFTMPQYDPYNNLFDAISLRQRIVIEPGLAYRKARSIDRSNTRTADGTLHTFTGSVNSTRFEIPLTWISSKDAADLSSWWETGADLRFYENDSSPASYYAVRMVGKENPFQQFQRPYPDQFLQGKLTLVTL